MAAVIEHKHLLIRAECNKPPIFTFEASAWMRELIKKIGMELLSGPHAERVEDPGNVGVTCVAIIKTSHLAMHVWEESSPSVIQLDVYTCGPLQQEDVFDHLAQFEPTRISWKYLDREHDLKEIASGS